MCIDTINSGKSKGTLHNKWTEFSNQVCPVTQIFVGNVLPIKGQGLQGCMINQSWQQQIAKCPYSSQE